MDRLAKSMTQLLELVRFLGEVAAADPTVSRVDQEYRLGGRAVADIVVWRGQTPLVVEVKTRMPAVGSLLTATMRQLERLREAFVAEYRLEPRVILAAPSVLSAHHMERLEPSGAELWDLHWMIREGTRFEDDLSPGSRATLAGLRSFAAGPTDRQLEVGGAALGAALAGVKCGSEDWVAFQKYVADLFEYLFVPPLEAPIYELSDAPRVNRRDIILPNYAQAGTWSGLRARFAADYVVIEVKNTCRGAKKDHILQLANYLKEPGAGLFGIVAGRTAPRPSAVTTTRDQWILHRKMIVHFADDDYLQMLDLKAHGLDPAEVLTQKIEEFRLAI